MTSTPIIHVHGDSLRIGIHLAHVVFTGRAPDRGQVDTIASSRPPHVAMSEFPLEMLAAANQARRENRRMYALRGMEVMLHHAGDSSLLTNENLTDIAAKAWRLAAAMEAQENVSASLDTLDAPKTGNG